MKTDVASWLTEKYLEWQKTSGKRQTVTAFAEYLGVSRDVLNQWMNGRRSPSSDSAAMIAEKLGFEIFDVLGLPRPDPIQQLVIRLWGRLTDDEIRAIEQVVRGAEKRGSGEAQESRSEPKRARSHS